MHATALQITSHLCAYESFASASIDCYGDTCGKTPQTIMLLWKSSSTPCRIYVIPGSNTPQQLELLMCPNFDFMTYLQRVSLTRGPLPRRVKKDLQPWVCQYSLNSSTVLRIRLIVHSRFNAYTCNRVWFFHISVIKRTCYLTLRFVYRMIVNRKNETK